MTRRFKPPWSAERIPGGYVVKDATGQALAYVYARDRQPVPRVDVSAAVTNLERRSYEGVDAMESFFGS